MAGFQRPPDVSIEDLYDCYAHLVYRRCLKLLGNEQDAEDALQEVYVRAMQAIDKFRGECSPMTWLYRISTNHCLNLIRSSNRCFRAMAEKKKQSPPFGPATFEKWEDIQAIHRLLGSVDKKTRQIIVYRYLDGMNQDEVARHVRLSVPTVRKKLNKFIEKVRQGN